MKHFKKLIRPYLIWSFVIIVIPILLIVLYAFTTGGNSVLTWNFTLDNLKKVLEPTYMNVFLKSLVLGAITTVI